MEIFTLLNFILLALVGFHASLPRTNAAHIAHLDPKGFFKQLCIDEYTAKLVHDKSLRAGGKEVDELFLRYLKLMEHRIALGSELRIYHCPPGLVEDLVYQLRLIANPSVLANLPIDTKPKRVQPANIVGASSASKQKKELSTPLSTKEAFKQLCMDEYTAKLVHDKSLRAGGKEVEELFKKYKDLMEYRMVLGSTLGIHFCPPGLVEDIVYQLRELAKSSVQRAHPELKDGANSASKHHLEKDSSKSEASRETFHQLGIDELAHDKSSHADGNGQLFDDNASASGQSKKKDSFKSKVSNLFGCFGGPEQRCTAHQ